MKNKMQQMKNNWVVGYLIMLFLMLGCSSPQPKEKYYDTPTSGRIAIAVDESFKPIMERLIHVFEGIYTDAKIDVRYVSEAQAINDMLFDTVRFAVVGRDINDYEKYIFDTIQITPRKAKIAKDALCFLVNKNNPESEMYTSQLADIFEGKTQSWNQINKKSKLGKIQVVFDQNQSSNVQMLFRLFVKNEKFPSYCYATKSNEEVFNYVKTNKNAIGVIGAAWISDSDDTTNMRFRSEVKVLALSSEDSLGFYQPFQAHIATKDYPLTREVYIISKEARSGLGAGFMAFITHDKGQRVILKSGLVPATMPIRLVHINTGNE